MPRVVQTPTVAKHDRARARDAAEHEGWDKISSFFSSSSSLLLFLLLLRPLGAFFDGDDNGDDNEVVTLNGEDTSRQVSFPNSP